MMIALFVIACVAAYIGIGSIVSGYLESRYDYDWSSEEKFFYPLGLPITFFVLLSHLFSDFGMSVSDWQNQRKNTLMQYEKNKQIKYRIAEKQLLQAEKELESELQQLDDELKKGRA